MKPEEDETTGLPRVRSWRTVYLAVAGIFVVWVALLAALMLAFS